MDLTVDTSGKILISANMVFGKFARAKMYLRQRLLQGTPSLAAEPREGL